ncbi:MAG: histidine kinase [Spirochaetales bacterium]
MVWTIRNKQLSFFAALIGLISFISLYSQYRLSNFLDEFQSNLDSYFTINQYLIELRDLRKSMNRFIREGSLESLQKAMSAKEELKIGLEKVHQQSISSMETYFLLQGLRNGQEVCLQKYMEAIELKQKDIATFYLPYYGADRVAEYLEGYTSQLLNIHLTEGNARYKLLTRRVGESRRLTLVLLVVITVLCLGFALLFTNSLTQPIQRLAFAAERMARGELDTPSVPITSEDEVGILEVSFNRMRENLYRMFTELQEKAELEKKLHQEELHNLNMQRSLKEAQFLNLQSQINPHFLFNTLNLLSRFADFEKAERTANLVRSLAHLFRYSFKKHGLSVSLKEELDFIEEYLRIQTLRFGNRIHYIQQCRIDPNAVRLPAFTLEPFVENALLYGLEPKEEGGILRVKISQFKGTVRIRVLDTGLGMEEAKKKRLQILLLGGSKGAESNEGIGISNVQARLKIYFDSQEEIKIYSKRGRGTLVWISIPANGSRTSENFHV